jgi:hypothetical protein
MTEEDIAEITFVINNYCKENRLSSNICVSQPSPNRCNYNYFLIIKNNFDEYVTYHSDFHIEENNDKYICSDGYTCSKKGNNIKLININLELRKIRLKELLSNS